MSAVIGVVMIVAMTVLVASAAAVWLGGFHGAAPLPEEAGVRASLGDSDGDGRADVIKLILVRGDSAYRNVTIGGAYGVATFGLDADPDANSVCTGVPAHGDCGSADFGVSDATWDVGQVLYVPCLGPGDHSLVVTLRTTVVLADTLECEAAN